MAEIVDFGLQQHKIKMDGRFFENALTVVAGDTARRLEVQLLDTNNMVQDTTGLKLRLNAVVSGKATYTDAILIDATKGLYHVDLTNGMLLVPGNWQFQWQIIDANDKKLHSFAFTGSVGSNLSEGGSEATNFYLNADELKQMQDDLINGTFDSEVLETNIAEKLNNLETQYAPKLNEVTAQLEQKAQQVDVESQSLRIDNLVLESGGDSNIEVADARFSPVKAKTYNTLTQRISEVEKETKSGVSNQVKNGDFSQGTDEWTKTRTNVIGTVDDNRLTIETTANEGYQQNYAFKANKKYYISASYKLVSGTSAFLRIFNPNTFAVLLDLPNATSEMKKYSSLLTLDEDVTLAVYMRVGNSIATFSNVIVYNLTEFFGEGKEPSLTEFENMIRGFEGFSVGAMARESYLVSKYIEENYSENNNIKTPEEIFSEYLKSGSKVKLLGDSITHGVGGSNFAEDGELLPNTTNYENPNGYCWANSLRDLFTLKGLGTVKNWGVRGKDSQFYVDNLQAYIETDDDLIVLMIGTNDRHSTTAPNTLYNNLIYIIDYVHGLGKKIIVMSANAVNANNDNQTIYNYKMFDVNKTIQKACHSRNIGFISNYITFLEYEERTGDTVNALLADGLHPNDTGYEVMFKHVTRSLGIGYVQSGITA